MEHICGARGALVPLSRARRTAMPPAAAAKSSENKAPSRVDLCRELLEIERDNPAIFQRIDQIKTLLKLQADSDGSFRETFANLGYVSVSPGKAASVEGEKPVVVQEAWLQLKQVKRDK